jgi:hypothetical protein
MLHYYDILCYKSFLYKKGHFVYKFGLSFSSMHSFRLHPFNPGAQ